MHLCCGCRSFLDIARFRHTVQATNRLEASSGILRSFADLMALRRRVLCVLFRIHENHTELLEFRCRGELFPPAFLTISHTLSDSFSTLFTQLKDCKINETSHQATFDALVRFQKNLTLQLHTDENGVKVFSFIN